MIISSRSGPVPIHFIWSKLVHSSSKPVEAKPFQAKQPTNLDSKELLNVLKRQSVNKIRSILKLKINVPRHNPGPAGEDRSTSGRWSSAFSTQAFRGKRLRRYLICYGLPDKNQAPNNFSYASRPRTTSASYLACALIFVRNGYLDCLEGIEYIELHEESFFLIPSEEFLQGLPWSSSTTCSS